MGKGGGGPTQTTSTSNTSNIPEYAEPYVNTMLSATQNQLFNTRQVGASAGTPATYDAEGNQTSPGTPGTPGSTEITGFKPYKSFGGTYDASGNMTSYDPSKSIAGFSPAQEQAQRGIMGLQMPGQYNDASNITQQAALGSLGAQYNPMSARYNQVRGAQTQAAQMGYVPMSQAAMGFGQNMQGATGVGQDMQAAQLGNTPQAQAAAMQAAQLGNTPFAQASQFGGPQNVGAQNVGTQDYTGQNVSNYMNPYLQSALAPQLEEVQRQYDITGTQQKSNAARSGAFGGSREALMAAENQRNAGIAKNQIIGQGYNQAFQNAQQQFNAQQQANLQAQQANQGANLQAGLANQSMGYNTGLQNAQLQQQANLANQGLMGQYGLQQGQFGQAANQFNAANQQQANLANQALAGQYGIQQGQFGQAANQANQAARNQFGMANLSNQQAANAANQQAQNQFGMANLSNQQQSGLANQALMGQYGMQQGQFSQAANLANQQSRNQANLANQQAQLAAQGQNIGQQQFGANYRMQGLGQAGQLGNQLANIGGQQLAAQQGILTAQNAVGAQQQQLRQQEINQAIQDYANAQQYPLMQLGTMSNMLRGLPMQAQTTQQYQAQANPITQGIGALGAGASLYNATKGAKGGIMSYDVGGSVRAKLEDMPDESLKAQLKSSSSESIKNDIKQILATRSMAGVKQAASGGILRYAEPNEENNQGVTTSRDVKYPNEAIARDAQMYKNLGAYLGPGGPILDAPNRVFNMVRDNVVSPAVRGVRNFINDDPAIQKIKYGYGEENKKDFFVTPEQRERDAANIQTVRDNKTEKLINPDGKTPDPKSILAANPTGTSPAGTAPTKVTTPAGTNPAAAAADKNAKIPTNRVNAIVGQNQQLKDAMGDNTPEAVSARTISYFDKISEKIGVPTKPPVDEYAGMSTEKIAEQLEKERTKFLGANPSAKQREAIMAEKSNAQDEAKRTQAFRMAEFFALWGSTPGSTLVAGLNAMKAKVPDFIADRKEATKIRRDMDKSIAELDRVDYLEKAGRFDEAGKKRAKATETALNTWGIYTTKALSLANTVTKEIGDTQRNEAAIAGRSKDVETQAKATVEAARIRGDGANTGIKDLSNIQARITGLMDQERKLRVGPLKTDLKFIEHEAAILKNDPKRIDDINKAKLRVKEQLDPIKAEIEQLNRVKMNLGAIQNLPGQASGTTNPNLPDLNSDKYKLK